jgi:hypothetical protein
MNKLIKIDDISPALTESEKAVVLASATPRIRNIEPLDLAQNLVNYIGEAYVILGHSKKSNETDIAIMSKLVTDKLQRKYPNYKEAELWHAIRNGAFGEYDTPDGITYVSAKNIVYWCNCYQSNKHETLLKQLKYKEKLSEEEREQNNKKLASQYWNDLHNKVKIDYENINRGEGLSLNAWVYYKSLDKIGVITIDTDVKKAKYNDIYNTEYAKLKRSSRRVDEHSLKEEVRTYCRLFFYEQYLRKVKNWTREENKIIKNVALNDLF